MRDIAFLKNLNFVVMRYLFLFLSFFCFTVTAYSQKLEIENEESSQDYDPFIVIGPRSYEGCLQMQTQRVQDDNDISTNSDGPVDYKYIEFPLTISINLAQQIVNGSFNCNPIYIEAKVGDLVTYIGPIEFEHTGYNYYCQAFRYQSYITPRITVADCSAQTIQERLFLEVVTLNTQGDFISYNWNQPCLGRCGIANSSLALNIEICCDGDNFVSRTVAGDNIGLNNLNNNISQFYELYSIGGVFLGKVTSDEVVRKMRELNLHSGIYFLRYLEENKLVTKKIAFVN